MKELIAVHKPIMLDGGNFRHCKVRMRHVIWGIDEEAWAAVVWLDRTNHDRREKKGSHQTTRTMDN